ncbi:unnamed protein product [Lactuca saligna]|uniref:Uncharacterized protein n=1 Tax=Lactuca saligna TaxID=75948 RepID=A0AA35Y7E3_LACSI|nr:unnamed protein product [Lactuca saligna]
MPPPYTSQLRYHLLLILPSRRPMSLSFYDQMESRTPPPAVSPSRCHHGLAVSEDTSHYYFIAVSSPPLKNHQSSHHPGSVVGEDEGSRGHTHPLLILLLLCFSPSPPPSRCCCLGPSHVAEMAVAVAFPYFCMSYCLRIVHVRGCECHPVSLVCAVWFGLPGISRKGHHHYHEVAAATIYHHQPP